LNRIGQECLKYSGSVNRTKMPVYFQIMEVGPGSLSEQDRSRLEEFKRDSIISKVVLAAWKLDTISGKVWTNTQGGLLARRPIEQLLREPRVPDAELMRPLAAPMREHFPLVTVALLAVLAVVFVCELVYGVQPWSGAFAPSLQTLVALGGLNKTLALQSGEWYRIFSATLLHGDIIHIGLNGICLFVAGAMLENIVGRRWFFALFVVGGVCGSLMSLALNSDSVVSVGASGAIMCLLAAAFVCSFRYPFGALRTQIQMRSLQILIPSLLPLAVSRTGEHIDFAGHLGGALSGALIGLVMLKTWRATEPRPAFMPAATALCAAGALALALSFVPLMRDYHTYSLASLLIPDELLPKSDSEAAEKAYDLVARYPRDPRARMFKARLLMERNDLPHAEQELRVGLAEEEILTTQFQPELAARMKAMLALILGYSNRTTEAKALAQPACRMTTENLASIRNLLVKAQLCGN
jgi:rhomboid protease GluP